MNREPVGANMVDIIASSNTSKTLFRKAKDSIVTRSFQGRFRRLRIQLAGLLVLVFFGAPWLSWNGRQAVLWDLDERKFYIFGTTFWPQDLQVLSGILIIAALGLLTANVFVGRVWCGYVCPQSVWTWAFMWVEKITEGDRNQRIKLANEPISFQKTVKRLIKHSIWILMGTATGIAFIGYFVPVRELSLNIISGHWFNESAFWVSMFAIATYANAGWLREQVCLHMCPYARFQSVMFDKDTLVVTYDSQRGDKRGSRKKEDDHKALGLGDCIDCYQCVQVCPTGIDIRDGLQMDCIGCAACIDVCDSIMDKMNYPRGLISYTSEKIQSGQRTSFLRPRVLAYCCALIIVALSMGALLHERELISVSALKDRNLYRINNEGNIVNVYRLKIINKTQQAQHYKIGLEDAGALTLARDYQVDLSAGEILDVPVSVVLDRSTDVLQDEKGSIKFSFVVTDTNNFSINNIAATRFIYPIQQAIHSR